MKYAIFNKGNLLIDRITETEARLPHSVPAGMKPSGETFRFGDVTAFATDAEDERFTELRSTWPLLPHEEYAEAAKAEELIHWDRTVRYCSRCCAPMKRHTEISKKCTECGTEVFPQMTPAILVIVRKDDKALLVHAKNFRHRFFGLVAGFVETGESLEECVAREVKEETSLEITNIRYFGSQTWPFPSNLMIGFTADYAGGEIRFVDGELAEGGFFSREDMPPVPTWPSLARVMIDAWKEGKI